MSETRDAPAETTAGHLLGGRIRHTQFRDGHRTGIEPVLLAASLPARPGERVLEAGCGSGAGLLCLSSRVPEVRGVGVERSEPLAAVARANAAANAFDAITIVSGAIEAFADDCPFDHAFANPPWFAADSTPSPDLQRDAAHRADPELLHRWIAALAACLRRRGTLTLALPAGEIPRALAAFDRSAVGSAVIFPLWPRDNVPAKLALLHGVRDGRAACRILPGMILHAPGTGYTDAANAVLRDGAAITL